MFTNDTFVQYLKPLKSSLNTKWAIILTIITALSSVLGIFKFVYNFDLDKVLSEYDVDKVLTILFYTNIILFLIICIWLILQKPPKQVFYNITKLHDFSGSNNKEVSLLNFISKQKDLEHRFKRANDSIAEFMKWFKFIWLGWFLLYAVTFCFSLDGFNNLFEEKSVLTIKSVLINTTNNLTSLFFFFCLLVLNEIAIRKNNDTYKVQIAPKWYLFFGLIIVFEIALHAVFKDNKEQISTAFAIISGLFAMISMSLLLGRLDSKLIDGLPMTVLVILFGYAGIQLFLPIFLEEGDGIFINLIWIMYLALFCKIVLLIFIFWMIDTNRLFFYFLAVYRIHSNINNEWVKIKDAFTTKRRITKTDISGEWKVYEYYFSDKNYGGFVTGEMKISYFNGGYNGTIKLTDTINPSQSQTNSISFTVLQKIRVTQGIDKKFTFIASDPEILMRNNIDIENKDYHPDKWIGIQIDDDTIIGSSEDENGIQGNFCFKRVTPIA